VLAQLATNGVQLPRIPLVGTWVNRARKSAEVL
jgi:hypothetical protein